jgi:hypothetical protein
MLAASDRQVLGESGRKKPSWKENSAGFGLGKLPLLSGAGLLASPKGIDRVLAER